MAAEAPRRSRSAEGNGGPPADTSEPGNDRTPDAPRWLGLLLLVLVALKATAYWWGSLLAWPDNAFSTFVIYRGQDIQALPLIHGISNLNPGEPAVLEWLGFGTSVRVAPYALHAALFAVLGAPGFLVGDLLISLATYFLLAWLFRLAGVGSLLARGAAALLVCLTIGDFGGPDFRVAGIEFLFWGLRIPRPFVSDLFLLTVVVAGLLVLRDLRAGARPGHMPLAAAGIGIALLLQSDIFAAAGLGLGLLIGIVVLVVTQPRQRDALFRSTGISALWALLFSLPLLQQFVGMRQDLLERLGVFPVSRLDPPLLFGGGLTLAMLLVLAVPAALHLMKRKASLSAEAQQARWLFALLAVGAFLALPASAVVLGSAMQVYHYPLALTRALWLAAIVFGIQAAQPGADRLRSRLERREPGSAQRTLALGVVALIIVPCLLSAWRLGAETSRTTTHMRTDVAEYASLPDYRTDFVDLIRNLPPSSRDDPVVLATFDHQVWSWWLTFGGGYSYLADACTTTLPDPEIERRLVSLARTVGMNRGQFLALLRRRFMLSFWHSCARYQANVLRTFRPLDDYTGDDRDRILNTRPTDSFNLALPISEERRLAALFAEAESSAARLDVIVLAKHDFFAGLGPSAIAFEKVFANRTFTVWQRRGLRPAAVR